MTTLNKILLKHMALSEKYNTKSALAEQLHISRPSLHDRFKGKVEWKYSEIRLLCRILDIPDNDKLKML